ncbi:MAG TPA: macro domain-containing protein [Geminicoccus sp.]|jgi:O-acetyl-ADP-ribose deacetylase (regulator of RNase III)|uniref:macro domain-containing protein n=1 Tax=Geminicoccus sp. TaxID=2024832 RepID=UPI002E3350E7|nr:macro domain-containing protein [Geminicoccus sp.]HEX2525087.1 macro domain-containing protein [Geminicoccus sp.]
MTMFATRQADITTLAVDAIVNAANAELTPGSGVSAAIHRAAGPDLAVACAKLAPCGAGEVRTTPGFALPAKFVIHAVGPVWQGGEPEGDRLLASCYEKALTEAACLGCSSVAFPAIATGAHGFPAERAAAIAVAATRKAAHAASGIKRVVFACADEASVRYHRQALELPY